MFPPALHTVEIGQEVVKTWKRKCLVVVVLEGKNAPKVVVVFPEKALVVFGQLL